MKNKILYGLFYTMMLYIIELVMFYVVYLILSPFEKSFPKLIDIRVHSFKNVVAINLLRFVFYYIIYFILFILLLFTTDFKNKIWKISIINCSLYVFISLLFGFGMGTGDFFCADFFYYFLLSTLLSPWILDIIPYFKKMKFKL